MNLQINNMKWAFWPTIDKELGDNKYFLKDKVLNAGSGTRKITLPNATKIVNLDIQKFAGVDIVSDLEQTPFCDEEFDGVVSIAVLEHCRKPWKVVAEIARVTKQGGNFLCVVPFMQPIHKIPTDYFRFTPDGITSLLEDNGFEIKNVESTHSFFHIIGWYFEDITKNWWFVFRILLTPFSALFYVLTRFVNYNINTSPCVITVKATKK